VEVDRQDFLKTLAEPCRKTGWQAQAWRLMGNHFHLVVPTSEANLMDGMRWLLSTYSNRFNHRRRKVGHLLSGRYKAPHVEGNGNGSLRTVCDDAHLNPARARWPRAEQRLIEYPWSSFAWHLAGREHRPGWMISEPLFGEHGIAEDSVEGRREFERRTEARRQDPRETGDPMRRGWYLGTTEFKQEWLARMEGRLGKNHAGQWRREAAEAKAQRIIERELKREGWNQAGENRSWQNGAGRAHPGRNDGHHPVAGEAVADGHSPNPQRSALPEEERT
jgi:REP element-mobilizing transposase RayT